MRFTSVDRHKHISYVKEAKIALAKAGDLRLSKWFGTRQGKTSNQP